MHILMSVKIFQFLHDAGCIIGQSVSCRKENLIAHEYRKERLAAVLFLVGFLGLGIGFVRYFERKKWDNKYIAGEAGDRQK